MKDTEILSRIRNVFDDDDIEDFDFALRDRQFEETTVIYVNARSNNPEDVYDDLVYLLDWLIEQKEMKSYKLVTKFNEMTDDTKSHTRHQAYTIYFD